MFALLLATLACTEPSGTADEKMPRASAANSDSKAGTTETGPSAIEPHSPPQPPPSPSPQQAVLPHQEVGIPAGSFFLGSRTGSANRNASREADHVAMALAEFAIDALPYPNVPGQPARHSLGRAEAEALCAADGKRLCTEFEWERACKGPNEREYPGEPFDAAKCASDPAACRSPDGVFAMGTLGREWTSSSAGRGVGDSLRSALIKGAPKDAPSTSHRCAARDAATPDSKSDSLLFRCCRGLQPHLTYPEESPSEPFREQGLERAEVERLLQSMPETASIAHEFKTFTAEQVTQRLGASGRSHSSMAPWVLAPKGLWWSPQHGEQLGVLAGDTQAGALLVVFYKEASGNTLFGASYLTRGEHDAILVAYKPDVPREVLFSTCWGCGGEGGAIEIGPDARVRIAQR